jgi:hypothetical protein
MERWGLFEALHGRNLSAATIVAINEMNVTELREGVAEFLLKLLRSGR